MSVPSITNCPNCGAPIDRSRDSCEYCGTPYEKSNDVHIEVTMPDQCVEDFIEYIRHAKLERLRDAVWY